MSSPHSASSSVPSQGRKIAPLPRRSRGSSNPGSSQNVLSTTNGTSSEDLVSETNQTLSTTVGISIRRHSYQTPDTTEHARHLSPPAPDASQIASQSGEPRSKSLSSERQETYTLRVLHNITPRPSPEPEEIRLSSSQDSGTGLNDSSLAKLSTRDHEIAQPLHTMYSDEKIVIPAGGDRSGRSVPTIVGDHSDTAADTHHASSFRPTTPLSLNQVPSLSPSLEVLRPRSVSDVSDVSDNNDNTAPYDVRDEEAPLEPFFTSSFQAALQNGLGIASKLDAAIEKLIGSSKPSSDLERLFNDARRLGTFQSSDTRTIAVLGDSGEGKSSLINALLHFPEIAKTGDIGAACTSVVTEYRQKTREHTSPITIEVEYLSGLEIEDLIKELLWNYRQIYLPDIEEDKVDPKDYARYQRESEQAWSALEAGFKHQRGFNKRLVSDMTEEGLAKATDQLVQWTRELEWPDGGNSGFWKATADTAEECCEMTSIFMEDRFWPFTKIIRVYLNAQVLKTGVVLADLPGLQDTNLARVRATQTYLMKCDNVFIVAKISRAITDQSLKSSLYSILARHAPVEWEESGVKSLNLAVVCTKSEDINQKTARREFCGPHKKIPLSVMEQLDKNIEYAKKNSNKTLKKELKRKQEFLLINARNSHVKEGLQNAYASKVPGGRLEVFCVSNTTYEKFSRKGNTEMVLASGIPELRRFCHKITAGAQLLEAKHFLQSTLSSLLSSVEIWASSSPPDPHPQVEDREQDSLIHDVLREVKEEVLNTVKQSKADFKDTFREVLSTYLERQNQSWENAAEAKGREWYSWHWSQYNAWCLNRGDHETGKRGHVNWNAELIWKMRTELAFQWGLVEDEIPIVLEKLLQSIRTCFLNLQSHLREQGFAAPLVQGIDFRVQDIEYKFSLVRQDFTREVKTIQRYASEPNDSSYVVSEMVPAYRAAAGEYGTGKAARQRAIVQGRITNGTLFPHISAKIQASIDKLVRKTFGDLKDAVDAILNLIVNDVEMALTSNPQRVDSDSARNQEDPEEQRRKEALMAEIKELKGEHEKLLASISDILPRD
ncbi:hypothetical protein N431DRAFT_419424 [Stipitochalara longipes BDJ]|nr:hypothetical protein N431DRAFT_419424 [Stipitochalara longipes BDJ]